MGARQGLQGDALLRTVTDIALEVQRSSTLSAVFEVTSTRLEAIGFDVAVLAIDSSVAHVRHVSARLSPLAKELRLVSEGLPDTDLTPITKGPHPGRAYIADLPARFASWAAPRFSKPIDTHQIKRSAFVCALRVAEQSWGLIAFMHDELAAEHADPLSLLALQLSSAIDLSNHFELLDRRTSELALVHQLAVTGPRADTRALCYRALDLVCRSTQANAGVLHRFDEASGDFEMVGDSYGYQGPLVEGFRRFKLPANNPLTGPLSIPVTELRQGAEIAAHEGFKYFAILPMTLEGSTVGTLCIARREDRPFTDDDLRAAEILGVQTSALLERVRLNDEANRLYRDLKRSYDELARTQAELVRHERLAALGELAAVMAHEVRNPLGVIFNSLTTLKRLLKPTGDADMLLNIVGEEADRLNRIVGDLLDFVRPYELMKKPIAIEPVVVSAVDAASQTLTTANVRVVTEFERDLPPFPADSHLLKQALVNLVVNAVQAMPKGGNVMVRVEMDRRQEGAWLIISVCDEGVGLSPRAAEKMFQPFFTTKATGTGLGLAVVKRIVDGHQGEVIATPNPSGRGTMFSVRLPPSNEREREGTLTPPRARPSVER